MANIISEIRAIIPATIKGHCIKISRIIEKIITKNNPIINPRVSIKTPPSNYIIWEKGGNVLI